MESQQDKDLKKCEEIFILMNVAKMTLSEINTLTDNERFFLSKFFIDHHKKEEEDYKRKK